MTDVVIAAARRTPVGSFMGSFGTTPAHVLGKAAIEAALNPDDTNFLYFVADGSGGHAFAETLEEHNANVARWRALERQQQQQNSP